MKIEGLSARLEATLERSLRSDRNTHQLIGLSTTLPLASLLAKGDFQRSQLVVLPDNDAVQNFLKEIELFEPSPQIWALPHFDVSPYSGLYPSSNVLAQRIQWLSQAQLGDPAIFVASCQALLQKTLPTEALADSLFEILSDQTLDEDLTARLTSMGYRANSLVEEPGTFSKRGDIFDFFSPAHPYPVRIELFGDVIESLRFFDLETQRSLEKINKAVIAPPRELWFSDDGDDSLLEKLHSDIQNKDITSQAIQEIFHSINHRNYFHGIDFLLPYFYKELALPTDHFLDSPDLWFFDVLEASRQHDNFWSQLKEDYAENENSSISPNPELLFSNQEVLNSPINFKNKFLTSRVDLSDGGEDDSEDMIRYQATALNLSHVKVEKVSLGEEWNQRLNAWKSDGFSTFIVCPTENLFKRLEVVFDSSPWNLKKAGSENNHLTDLAEEQKGHPSLIHVLDGQVVENTLLNEEKMVLLKATDFVGKKTSRSKASDRKEFQKKASALNFGDLKVGDLVVHIDHGVGVYEGLELMNIGGVDTEFIRLSYKDKDRLFLPIYRVNQIQKYSGPSSNKILDKLGGNQWETTKSKVKKRLRDIAADLLKIYSEREKSSRPPFSLPNKDFLSFENHFPFEETEDQNSAIESIIKDMTSDKPMDRLVCGDVGFGKTEVAMRAAFKAVEDGKQVAILAPTTVLTFQHFENFKKRFKPWSIEIKALNRFLSAKEAKEVVTGLKDGKVDIVIGTHRLLSKDVGFKDLGLLVVDEEQKFGVVHKEKIRKMKASVDTLTMSATPIPRTLNMSLTGVRDLSLINTAPVDRLPTRTFVCKPNPETIRKAIVSEVERGGQVFFLHNRVQSIYATADELRQIVPGVRIKVAHGQMEEKELEQIMTSFFRHEIDVLVCTTIIESGLDVPKANTMFIDRANTFGLSQLYQLRGRVGRSKTRAYCYLLLPKSGHIDPDAQERLKVIQENTALGSGIKIAHYDLELRGSGNILGADQSGHINSVGYEMYIELLEQAIREAKGETVEAEVDPEVNVKIPAFIPDNYIKDIRTRLAYYKTLSQIEDPSDLDNIEDDLTDQFGKIPPPVLNLMGLMLIRLLCKKLKVKDLSSSAKAISLSFADNTPLPADRVIQLTSQSNKKYSFTPDNRLRIRMNEILWPKIYDELLHLEKICEN